MNMFSVRPTTRPLRRTVATVSSPSATSSTASSPRSPASASNEAAYSQSRSSIHWRAASFVPQKGSGIRPARRRSVWTQPGTTAATRAGPAVSRSFPGREASGTVLTGLFQAEELGHPAEDRVVLLRRVAVAHLEGEPERLRRGHLVVDRVGRGRRAGLV